ncbi:syntaxin-6-like [Mytilus californianus]|uniref:syntaxin-6-like n=1 Tax=Mytilus californianus TaxID=6549 RepID=UPI0022461BDC|nr:syntaxin-6-like [Mytilus californianus]
MSLEDPFFVVRDEVQKALQSATSLYERWSELINNPKSVSKEEYDWTTNELRNSLRSIDWDLEDLEETIDIVEKNLKKFKIDESELEDRRSFIRRTRVSVKSMKDNLSSKQTKGKDETNVRQALLSNGPNRPHDKYTRLDQEMERSNQRYIEDTSQQQQLIMRTQDDNMDLISKSVGSLKNMSQQIGSELEEQNVMLDEFHTEMDHTESRMDVTMKKLAKVMHMSNDKRQWCGIFVLIGILIVIIIFFFVL